MQLINRRPTPVAIVIILLAAALLAGGLAASRLAAGGVPALSTLAAPGARAQPGAPPALPSSLYGYVDGVEVGGLVAAAVGGVVVAETRVIASQGRPFYALNVPADDPATPAIEGGSPDATVELRVDGRPAGSAAWVPGSNLALNLPALATR